MQEAIHIGDTDIIRVVLITSSDLIGLCSTQSQSTLGLKSGTD